MPNQNKFDRDFNNFMSQAEITRQILVVQTEALKQIVTSEVSLDGGIAMKGIAEQALLESVQISREAKTEVF